jgi:hypothetical protein
MIHGIFAIGQFSLAASMAIEENCARLGGIIGG